MTTVKYRGDLPYVEDEEVRLTALRLFHSTREGRYGYRGNSALQHIARVAALTSRSYLLDPRDDDAHTAEMARKYAKAAALLEALASHSEGCQRNLRYKELKARLYGAAA